MPKAQPVMTVTPSSVSIGQDYTISGGTEFRAAVHKDGLLHFGLANPGCCVYAAVRPAADGSFEWRAGQSPIGLPGFPGTYRFNIIGFRKNGGLYTFASVAVPVA